MTTTEFSEFAAKAQEQARSAVRTAQDAVLDFLKPYAALAEPLVDAASTVAFAGRIPSPTEAIELWGSFAVETIKAQKDFAVSVLGLLADTAAAAGAA